MAKNTDPRFQRSGAFEGTKPPRRHSAEGRSREAADATRQRYFDASRVRYQHVHPVRVLTSRLSERGAWNKPGKK